jgi:hypothetical protein
VYGQLSVYIDSLLVEDESGVSVTKRTMEVGTMEIDITGEKDLSQDCVSFSKENVHEFYLR